LVDKPATDTRESPRHTGSLDYRTPNEIETQYYEQQQPLDNQPVTQ